MNQAQFISWLKTTLGMASGFAIGKGWVDSNTAVAVTGGVLALVPIIWGWVDNTHAAQVAQTAALPGVSAVVIKPTAESGLTSMAADPEQTKVKTQ